MVDITFDLSVVDNSAPAVSDLQDTVNVMLDEYMSSAYTYEQLLEPFNKLVQQFRRVSEAELKSLEAEVFNCDEPCEDRRKVCLYINITDVHVNL